MLETIVAISNKYGSNPEYVLAGGGNTSFKDENFIYIKGSGTTLADITAEGFVKMNRGRLGEIQTKEYPEIFEQREAQVLTDLMDAREKGEEHKRPSVETSLHDLFEYTYVLHLHPTMLNGMTCGKNGRQAAAEIFSDRIIWIDLIEPGYLLSLAVSSAMNEYKRSKGQSADIVILQNHGVFIAGNSSEEIDEKAKMVFSKIEEKIIRFPQLEAVDFDREHAANLAPAIRMLLSEGSGGIVTFRTNAEVKRIVEDEKSFYPASSAFTPDHMVYCKHEPIFIAEGDIERQYSELEHKINEYKNTNGYLPKIIAVAKLGYFAFGVTKKQADISAELFMDTVKVACYTESFGGLQFMSDYMIDFIKNWEVESYRSKVSAAGNVKRLNEKITVVTGAAQGFGLGIAEKLLGEGANLVLCDINETLLTENAGMLEKKHGKGRVMSVKCDVADESSVKNLTVETVLEYGGLDVFISNAGVVRAGSVEEMTLTDFEFVTKINYTAFFIAVKYATQIMKLQQRFASDYFADIIQINSKSGLSGSNKNFAYSGGKFGGIGLVESFALELAPFNIKVNAVCPGNLLTGPLWSDPEKGLFVQYLNAGKVPGAKTIGDVRKYYESKVPLGRGCEIIDVVRAIFYIIEQKYETGQAVPVTGGQNMLK